MVETKRAPAPDDEEIEEVARLIAQWVGLSMRLNRGRHTHMKAMTEAGMTIPQMVALHILMFEGATSVSTLTERLDLSLSATSHLVQRLVEGGLASREEHAQDRRQKVVSLTLAGHRFVEQMMKARLSEFRASVQHVSAELRRELAGLLKKIVEDLANKSAESWTCRAPAGVNMAGASLAGADLRGKDLERADLSGANLAGANLDGANLEGARVVGANLAGASLRGARLDGADLSRSNLEGADLQDASLRDVELAGANLEGADLTGATLQKTNDRKDSS